MKNPGGGEKGLIRFVNLGGNGGSPTQELRRSSTSKKKTGGKNLQLFFLKKSNCLKSIHPQTLNFGKRQTSANRKNS